MKKLLYILPFLFVATTALANEIYITQVGDNLDLDIVQDGTDNKIGNSTTDFTINGELILQFIFFNFLTIYFEKPIKPSLFSLC